MIKLEVWRVKKKVTWIPHPPLHSNSWNLFTEHTFQQLCKQSQSNVSNWIFNTQVNLWNILQLPSNLYPKSWLKVIMAKTAIAGGRQLSQFKSSSFLTQPDTRQNELALSTLWPSFSQVALLLYKWITLQWLCWNTRQKISNSHSLHAGDSELDSSQRNNTEYP